MLPQEMVAQVHQALEEEDEAAQSLIEAIILQQLDEMDELGNT
jgi:hypothetical protein